MGFQTISYLVQQPRVFGCNVTVFGFEHDRSDTGNPFHYYERAADGLAANNKLKLHMDHHAFDTETMIVGQWWSQGRLNIYPSPVRRAKACTEHQVSGCNASSTRK